MAESNNKKTHSKSLGQDSKKPTKRFLASFSIIFILCGILFLILGASVHELYSVISPAFFVAATLLLIKTQQAKIKRSTGYITASIITGSVGVLFLILGLYVHPVFAYGASLLYLYAGFGVYSFVIIIASGEILKISGIVKVVLLLIITIIIARIAVVTLEKVRHESWKAHMSQEQTKNY